MGIVDDPNRPDAGFAAGDDGWHAALAALAWQIDLGATEAIAESPIDRYELAQTLPAAPKAGVGAPAAAAGAPDREDPIAAARIAAGAAQNLDDLRAAIARFPHCDLHQGARNLVFSGGVAGARVLVLGDAPNRDDDLKGQPFSGPAGDLFDRMFGAINLARDQADPRHGLYLTNILPWRPGADRAPTEAEIAMFAPFVARHIALAKPEFVVIMGATACRATLAGQSIGTMRGQWADVFGLPAMAMFSPGHLLRYPDDKRVAWTDLQEFGRRLAAG